MPSGVRIAVVGPGAGATDEERAAAEEVGRRVAERGWILFTGGLGGVMEGASKGAASAGGMVVGILPGADDVDANRYLSVAVPTGLGELRNGILVRAVHGVIAIGGSWGTLSEVALAMRIGRPVVQLGGWEVAVPGPADPALRSAGSAVEAVAALAELLGASSK